jgi:hypothetical protein
MRRLISGTGIWVLALLCGGAASADTVTLASNNSTLGAALGPGAPSPSIEAILDSGNTTGLTFVPTVDGTGLTYTAPPPGSPAGTGVVDIAPADGENGFYEAFFTLPGAFANPMLTGAGNVDDRGTVFLNGTAITPVNALSEYGNATFSTTDASLFHSGTNVLLISDSNSGGGPSGAAFYANVAFSPGATPEPSGLTLIGFGIAGMSAFSWWRRKTAAS